MNDRQTVPPPAGSMNRASGRSVRVAALAFAALLIATAGLRLRAAPARPPAGHRNLIENGGFERGVEGWETGQGQVLIQDEKQAQKGDADGPKTNGGYWFIFGESGNKNNVKRACVKNESSMADRYISSGPQVSNAHHENGNP